MTNMMHRNDTVEVPIASLRRGFGYDAEARVALAAALAAFVGAGDTSRYLYYTNAAGLCHLARVRLVFDVA